MKMSYLVPKYCLPNQTDTKSENYHMVSSFVEETRLQLDTED